MDCEYILETLKIALKKKKVTYKEIASSLSITEAGIKKMFASKDISLSRLVKICDLIDIPLTSLIEASEKRPVKKLKINRIQTSFFSKNPDYFFFFLQLSNYRYSLKEMAKKNGLTEKSAWTYLKKLDDLKLIKLHPKNKIEHLYGLPLSVDTEGDFFKELRSEMAIRFIKANQKKKDEKSHTSMALLKLSNENIDQLKKEVQTLFANYQRQSEIDKTVFSNEELSDFSFLLSYSDDSFIPSVGNL